MPRLVKRILLALFGLTAGLVLVECALAIVQPNLLGARPMPMAEGNLVTFQVDEKFGFLPRLGEKEFYGSYGCVPNDYRAEDRGERQRILFVGDSVTHRGRLIAGLRHLYGEEGFEYWNAGVESFNTAQSLELYRRANRALKPDHVVLTFHNNDFHMTPVAIEREGKVQLYFGYGQRWGWLYRHSALYRHLAQSLASRNLKPSEVEQTLADFQHAVEADGARFSIVLLPILAPLSDWKPYQQESRANSLAIFKKLELRHFDLLESLLAALAEGVELEESPGDFWHPSDAAAAHFSRSLKAQGLLDVQR